MAWLLGFNKNTVQRIFQIKGWQVRKRAVGMRPRIQAVPSVAAAPDDRRGRRECTSRLGGFVPKRGAQIQTLDASLSNIARSILLSLSPAALVSPS